MTQRAGIEPRVTFPSMRQLLPTSVNNPDLAEVIAAEHRTHPAGRPWVFTNLVVALDGGIDIDGKSAQLSSDADKALFRALRAASDVLVVGASTARLERYRLPASISTPAPRLCVVSGSLDFDPTLPFLDHGLVDEANWPLIATGTAPTDDQRRRFDGRATLIELSGGAVRPKELLDHLAGRSTTRVLCEGGPRLLSQFAAAGLIDEWNLSIAPLFAGSSSARLSGGDTGAASPMTLDRLLIDGDHLFARYLTG